MICRDCAYAADRISEGGAGQPDHEWLDAMHSCEGCDCQHDWQSQLEGRSLR